MHPLKRRFWRGEVGPAREHQREVSGSSGERLGGYRSRVDPRLEGIRRLKTDWMSGLQFYLREPLPLTNGHVNYVNSPFALTSTER